MRIHFVRACVALKPAILALAISTSLSVNAAETHQRIRSVNSDINRATSEEAPVYIQRFVVRSKYVGTRADSTLRGALAPAVLRSGISRQQSGIGIRQRQTVEAVVQRRIALDGWYVVRTNRELTAREAQDFMSELRADPSVAAVEIDPIFKPTRATRSSSLIPNDTDYKRLQWNFHGAVGGVMAEQAWTLSTGKGVVVAVLDTGIVKDTEDLSANVVPGYDMISDKRMSRRASDGRTAGGWDVGSWEEENYCTGWATSGEHPPQASSWHGTHVAGTIAQETNNAKGLAGLAHGARVLPVRVLGSCGGFGSDIADAMIWAAGGEVAGVPQNQYPAEVLNMSLGSSGPNACPDFYQSAIDRAVGLGSVIIVAAGNDSGEAALYTMSSCKNVVSVGATGVSGRRAAYSNYGSRVDLAAPGGGGEPNDNGYIWQMIDKGETVPTGQFIYGGLGGTSMAAPHVSAVAAMMQSVAPKAITPAQMRTALIATSRAFPLKPDRAIGSGILDAFSAVKLAQRFGQPLVATSVRVGEVDRIAPLGKGETRLYSIDVTRTGAELNVLTYGGNGLSSIYIAYESEPFQTANMGSSQRPGTNQTISIANAAPGRYYLKVEAREASSGIFVRASLR